MEYEKLLISEKPRRFLVTKEDVIYGVYEEVKFGECLKQTE